MPPANDRRALDFEWRAAVDRQLADHAEALEHGEKRMTQLESAVDRLGESAQRISVVSQELAEGLTWFRNFNGFRNVLRLIGDVVVRVAAVILAAGVVWWFMATGQLPRKVESGAVRAPAVLHQPPPQEISSSGRSP